MDESMIASIKLVTGEEILCLLVDIIESGKYTSVLIQKPMLLTKNRSRRSSNKSYQISNWLVADDPNKDFYEINVDKIIITTVIKNREIIDDYKKFFTPALKPRPKLKNLPKKAESEIGYVGTVDDFRIRLEHIYKMDSHTK